MWDLHPDGTYRRSFVSAGVTGADWLHKLEARYELCAEFRTELLGHFVPTSGMTLNAVLLKGIEVERDMMARSDRSIVNRSFFNQIGQQHGWRNAGLELFCFVADNLTAMDTDFNRMHIWQIRTIRPAQSGFESLRFITDREIVLEQQEIDTLWGCDATLYMA